MCSIEDPDSCTGFCIPAPEAFCTKEYMPVCGCGGVEYGNRCEASMDGNVVKSQGRCDFSDDKPVTTGAPVTSEAPATTTEAPGATTPLPLPAMYHPDLNSHENGRYPCVYNNEYPEWYLDAEHYQTHLFATKEECCSVHPCFDNYADMWYPTIIEGDGGDDGINDEDGIVCVYRNLYPLDWINKEGFLFETEAECYDRHGQGEFCKLAVFPCC